MLRLSFTDCGMISIHALREEGDARVVGREIAVTQISIHALREEGDLRVRRRGRHGKISIHALREEGDEHLDRWIPDDV